MLAIETCFTLPVQMPVQSISSFQKVNKKSDGKPLNSGSHSEDLSTSLSYYNQKLSLDLFIFPNYDYNTAHGNVNKHCVKANGVAHTREQSRACLHWLCSEFGTSTSLSSIKKKTQICMIHFYNIQLHITVLECNATIQTEIMDTCSVSITVQTIAMSQV